MAQFTFKEIETLQGVQGGRSKRALLAKFSYKICKKVSKPFLTMSSSVC